MKTLMSYINDLSITNNYYIFFLRWINLDYNHKLYEYIDSNHQINYELQDKTRQMLNDNIMKYNIIQPVILSLCISKLIICLI